MGISETRSRHVPHSPRGDVSPKGGNEAIFDAAALPVSAMVRRPCWSRLKTIVGDLTGDVALSLLQSDDVAGLVAIDAPILNHETLLEHEVLGSESEIPLAAHSRHTPTSSASADSATTSATGGASRPASETPDGTSRCSFPSVEMRRRRCAPTAVRVLNRQTRRIASAPSPRCPYRGFDATLSDDVGLSRPGRGCTKLLDVPGVHQGRGGRS